LSKLDVVIAGEINFDLILYGLPQQMPVERELLADAFEMTLGGSSAIVAHNLAVLGSRVGFITKVGNDPLGQLALDRIRSGGVDLSRIVRSASNGSGITVILPHQRDRHMFTYLGTISEVRFEDLDFAYLKSAGLTTSLDTNDDPDDRWESGLDEILPYVDVLMPNEREAMKMARVDDLDSAIDQLSKRVPTLVVKLGSRGAMAMRDGVRFTAPPVEVKVVDPVGAGDSFDAGFLHQFLAGADLQTCLRYGNLCGAFSTTQPGGTEAFRDVAAMRTFLDRAW
jgi:sugar/nucleoside kinase (ribokinase family)